MPSEETRIAERFRTVVADEPLPSEDEWASVYTDSSQQTLEPPHLADRKVTVSIGSTNLRQPVKTRDLNDCAIAFYEEADTALYRAKTSGRDRTILFSEIVTNHGRIIEHDFENKIVAIDVGSKANTQNGQEFVVYHPKYTGETPFYFSDGRTEKQIGTYPRIASGLVEVIDVQADISFCRVTENRTETPFPTGCQLQAVPAGTITHLLEKDEFSQWHSNANVAVLTNLEEEVATNVDTTGECFAFVFTLLDRNKIVYEKGIGTLNRILASIYRSITDQFQDDAKIGLVSDHQVGVVMRRPPDDLRNKIDRIVESVDRSNFASARFVIGHSFPTAYVADSSSGDHSQLSPTHVIDYARFAANAVPEFEGDHKVNEFSAAIAGDILASYRGTGNHGTLLKDYARFREIGVRSATLENQVGLSHLSKSEFQLAISRLLQATRYLPDSFIITSNLGYAYYWDDQFHNAYKTFNRARENEPSRAWFAPYTPIVALTMYNVYLDDPDKVDVDELRELVRRARSSASQRSSSRTDAKLREAELKLFVVDSEV